MNYTYNNETLYHHGILGQKWGIRRFQNKDGSYTEEGKRRRHDDGWSDDYKEYKSISKKNVKQMSNKELKKVNERARLEQEYQRLNPSAIEKGIKIAATASMAALTVTQLYQNTGALIKLGKRVFEGIAWKHVGR